MLDASVFGLPNRQVAPTELIGENRIFSLGLPGEIIRGIRIRYPYEKPGVTVVENGVGRPFADFGIE